MKRFAAWLVGEGASINWLTWWGHGVQSVWFMLLGCAVLAGNFPPPEELGAWAWLATRVPLAGGGIAAVAVFLHREASNFAEATTSTKRLDKILDWLLGAVVAVMLTGLAWRFGFAVWWASFITLAYLAVALILWSEDAD